MPMKVVFLIFVVCAGISFCSHFINPDGSDEVAWETRGGKIEYVFKFNPRNIMFG